MSLENSSSPNAILKQIQEGNRLAFNSLFETHWDQLFQAAYKLLRDENLAKDVVQEVFFDLWKKRGKLKIENLAGYLYKAVRFQSLKQLRKAPLLDIHEENFQRTLLINETEEQLALNQLQEALQKSLDDLPERYRKVFEMSRVHHMSNSDIAKELNLSTRTVDWYLHAVIKHLKTTLISMLVLIHHVGKV